MRKRNQVRIDIVYRTYQECVGEDFLSHWLAIILERTLIDALFGLKHFLVGACTYSNSDIMSMFGNFDCVAIVVYQFTSCYHSIPFIYLLIHSSIYSSIHLFIHPFIHPSIYPFIHLFIHPFIHSFIYSFIHLFIHLSILSLFGNLSHQKKIMLVS